MFSQPEIPLFDATNWLDDARKLVCRAIGAGIYQEAMRKGGEADSQHVGVGEDAPEGFGIDIDAIFAEHVHLEVPLLDE